ncbi:uncharacterized protein L201_001401 [Kwoniella dendrophila CBS 6074]|uniref:FAD/NAD(P)-binding domain-containing protein n=1 Tax=Kwoniella dendrophila CBS 6074 TaxID=1295534 RepID=A0AAX4JNP3_9TREE
MEDKEEGISVLIIGCGPAGLVNARTLIQDGFKVTMVAKEDGVGGCWRNTYPDLTTNSPWGAFTFSGLDMPKPSNLLGDVVPARTYKRYLEDFYHHFIEGHAEVLLDTEISSLVPKDNNDRGWIVSLKHRGYEEERSFDRVVLATGYLGKPYTPNIFENPPVPTFHTSTLAYPSGMDKLLSTVSSSSKIPHDEDEGDKDTILVIGGGKSAMDTAAILANRGRKVIWAFRGPLKWFSPSVPPGMMGANRLDILFGPSRIIDSWTMWFYHCTSIGAGWVKAFWAMMRGAWTGIYTNNNLPPPTSDPFLSLAHFAGGIPSGPQDFLALLKTGKIASVNNVTPISVDINEVQFDKQVDGNKLENIIIKCGAIVTATGYKGGTYNFIDSVTRRKLGLERIPPEPNSEGKVLNMRKQWKTIQSNEVGSIKLPLVLRGILPYGRYEKRDLAITGATRPFFIPALTYEVESHWISSLFKDDPFLKLPLTKEKCLEEIQADNNFTRARYPGIDPYEAIPSGTYVSAFNDLSYTRVLLRDLSLDPWRQKDTSHKWWKFWNYMNWLNVRVNPQQYANLGEERKTLRESTKS